MKKIILTTLIIVIAMSAHAQTDVMAYIYDRSGTPTNVRNAPNRPEADALHMIGMRVGNDVRAHLHGTETRPGSVARQIDVHEKRDSISVGKKRTKHPFLPSVSAIVLKLKSDGRVHAKYEEVLTC